MKRHIRQESGFTLIELLVVVLIIGILASIAIPQYFKVVERSRVAEAKAFIGDVKGAQERYYAKSGSYVTDYTKLALLDLNFAAGTPGYGMKNFEASAMDGANCGSDSSFKITLKRAKQAGGTDAPPRYGAYTITFDKCTGNYTCSVAACTDDLM